MQKTPVRALDLRICRILVHIQDVDERSIPGYFWTETGSITILSGEHHNHTLGYGFRAIFASTLLSTGIHGRWKEQIKTDLASNCREHNRASRPFVVVLDLVHFLLWIQASDWSSLVLVQLLTCSDHSCPCHTRYRIPTMTSQKLISHPSKCMALFLVSFKGDMSWL